MLVDAVREALAELDLTPADKGATELALTYANSIDSGMGDIARVGPALLAVLESLGMTPKARAAIKRGVNTDAGHTSPLDELRIRRNSRINRSKAVDSATA